MLDIDFMSATTWLTGVAGLVGGVAILCNLPTSLWLPARRATLKYLAAAELQVIGSDRRKFMEAKDLSSLKQTLEKHGVNLYAVVHEVLGVEEFKNYFDGEIFLDRERIFYGPKQRWMFLSGFVRPSVWSNMFRAKNAGVEGNLKGEGRLLGGVFVLGPGEQGIIFEHREKEFGDKVDLAEITRALDSMKPPQEKQ